MIIRWIRRKLFLFLYPELSIWLDKNLSNDVIAPLNDQDQRLRNHATKLMELKDLIAAQAQELKDADQNHAEYMSRLDKLDRIIEALL